MDIKAMGPLHLSRVSVKRGQNQMVGLKQYSALLRHFLRVLPFTVGLLVAMTGQGASARDLTQQAAAIRAGGEYSANDVEQILSSAFSRAGSGGDVMVTLSPGTYHLDHPLAVHLSAGQRFYIRGRGGAVTLSGARTFAPQDERALPPWIAHSLASQALGRVKSYSLNPKEVRAFTLSVRRGRGESTLSSQPLISEGGKLLSMARWPTEGFFSESVSQLTGGNLLAQIPDAWPGKADAAGMIILGGFWAHDYQYEQLVGNVLSEGRFEIKPALPRRELKTPIRFAIFNSIDDLRGPGTFMVDLKDRLLIVWPDSLSDAISITETPNLLVVSGPGYAEISDFRFLDAADTALVVRNSASVKVSRCFIDRAAGHAIFVEASARGVIDECGVYQTGQAAILLSGGDRSTLRSTSTMVSNSVISAFGLTDRSYQSAVKVSGVGIRVLDNFISDGPHAAVILYGNDHLIEGNTIFRSNLDGGDAGSVYIGRDWTQRGNKIVGNWLIKDGPIRPAAYQAWSAGVYLDDLTSGTKVENNTFIQDPQPVLIGGGRDNTIDGNVFLNSAPVAITLDARGESWLSSSVRPNGALWRSLAAVPYADSAYAKYPHLAQILSDNPGSPKYNIIQHNAFYNTEPYKIDPHVVDDTVDAAKSEVESESNCATKRWSPNQSWISVVSFALDDSFRNRVKSDLSSVNDLTRCK